jgi:hypothetical protein
MMANVYYSYPTNRRGILRAVLSSEAARFLLKGYPHKYSGQEFPATGDDQREDIAVLRIIAGGVDEEFQAGFYVLDEDIMYIEEELQSLTNKLSPVAAK